MHSPADILRHAARQFGDKTALITADGTFSYRELDRMSNSAAHALRGCGIHPGDTVSLYSHNSWEWIVAYHAVLKAGAVINPVNAMFSSEELGYVLRDCAATAILTSAEHAEVVARLATDIPHVKAVVSFGATPPGSAIAFDALLHTGSPETCCQAVDPARPSSVCYTSGTTGHPKGAVQSHLAVLLNCALTATMHQRSPTDVVVTALPTAHVYGNVAVNSAFLAGGTVVLLQRFEPAAALHCIAEHGATMFEGVPAMYAMMLADPTLDGADLGHSPELD